LKSGYFPGAAGYLPEMHRLSLYFNLTRANMEARSLLLITMQANSPLYKNTVRISYSPDGISSKFYKLYTSSNPLRFPEPIQPTPGPTDICIFICWKRYVPMSRPAGALLEVMRNMNTDEQNYWMI
jgi:hypothetical protein